MALDDFLGNPDAQAAAEDLYYHQAATGDENVDPQVILNRLGRKTGTTEDPQKILNRLGTTARPPAAPAAPQAPTVTKPKTELPPLAPLEPPQGDGPQPKGAPAAEGKPLFGDEGAPVTGEETAPTFKGEGAPVSPEEKAPQPGQAPQVGGLPAVQPLDEQPFRSGGRVFDIMGSTTGMKSGEQAYKEQQENIAAAEATEEARKKTLQETIDNLNKGLPPGATLEEQAALRGRVEDAKRGSQAAIDEITRSKTEAPTQKRWRDIMERIPPNAAEIAIDTAAAAARIAMVPTTATGLTPNAQEKISDTKAAIEAYVSHRLFNSDPSKDHDFGTQLVQGIVSSAMFMAGGAAGKALGVGEKTTIAVLGALPQGEQQYAQAEPISPGYAKEMMKERYGIDLSETQAANVAKWGMFVSGLVGGSTEAIPLGHLFDRLERLSSGRLMQAIGMVVAQGGEEAVQEAVQQWMQNATAKVLLDPNQDINEQVADNAIIGFTTGALMTSVLGGGKMALDRMAGAGVPTPPGAVSPPGGATPPGATPAAAPGPTGATPPPGAGPTGAPSVAPPVAPPVSTTSGQPTVPPEVTILRKAGLDDTAIFAMSPEQQKIEAAKLQGDVSAETPGAGAEPPGVDSVLKNAGHSEEDISKLTPRERALEYAAAIQANVSPVTPEDDKRHGAIAEVFTADAYQGTPIPLADKGFTAEQIGRLEKVGLATNGAMTPNQFNDWSKAIDSGLRPHIGEQPKAGAATAPVLVQPPAAQSLPQGDGTRAAPIVQPKTGEEIAAAPASSAEATPAQGAAGNHQMTHVKIRGLPGITIEAKKGEVRRGVTKTGKPWEQRVGAHTGYFKGYVGKDGDNLDVYVGDEPDASHPILVMDENDRKGRFRQHKIYVGFRSPAEADEAYLNTQGKSAKFIRGMVEMSKEEFSAWIDDPKNLLKPVGETESQPPQKQVEEAEPPPTDEEIAQQFDRAMSGAHAEPTAENIAAVEEVVAATGEPVVPVDVQRAAEIVAATDVDPRIAFIVAVEQREANHGPVEPKAEEIQPSGELGNKQEGKPPQSGKAAEEQGTTTAPRVSDRATEAEARPEDREPRSSGEDGARPGAAEAAGAAPAEAERESAAAGAETAVSNEPGAAEANTKPAEPERERVPGGTERPAAERPAAERANGDAGERAGGAEANGPAEAAEPAKPENTDLKVTEKAVTDDIAAAIAAIKAEKPAEPRAKIKRKAAPDSTGDIIRHAAGETASLLDESLSGLYKLFGGPKLSEGFTFDKDTYEAAKPHFIAAAAHFKNVVSDIGKLGGNLVRAMHEKGFPIHVIENLQPYLAKFVMDVQSGAIDLKNAIADLTKTKTAAKSPDAVLAHSLVEHLKTGAPVTNKTLQDLATKAYGGTMAEGKFDRKDAHDALELAVNMMVKSDPALHTFDGGWQRQVQQLEKLLARLPTQTVRSDEQVAFQQFSTPPHYALAVAFAANVRDGDVIMEPSAGTGSLIAAAAHPNTQVVANELSPRRAELLRALIAAPGPLDQSGRVFTENAEQINNILPDAVKPTVVIMNPPFSQTAGRLGDKRDVMVGANHISQALARLEPGGRLVAIVGRGMSMEAPTFKDWWSRIVENYAVRANIGVEGSVYGKYGTNFGTRLLVIDKVPPNGKPVLADVKTIPELMQTLETIRGTRPEPLPAQHGRLDVAEEGGRTVPLPPPDQSGGLGVGAGSQGGLAGPGEVRPGSTGRPDAQLGTEQRPGVAVQQPGGAQPGGAGGKPNRKPKGGEQPTVSGGSGAQPDLQPSAGTNTGVAAGGERVEIEKQEEKKAAGALSDSLYETYEPQKLKIPGAKPHPGPLVESASMASVPPPDPTYKPRLAKNIIEDGLLSGPQIEAVVYAGQAHSDMLPAAEGEPAMRKGFFIGDGTGVGKGREIAGIILDNWNQGRHRAVWASENKSLLEDSKNYWEALGQDKNLVFDMGKVKAGEPIKAAKGISFVTYDTLKGGMSDQAALSRLGFIKGQKVSVQDPVTGATKKGTIASTKPIRVSEGNPVYRVRYNDGTTGEHPAPWIMEEGGKPTVKTRVDQLVDWLGKDFDGVIAFDEAHNMGNATEQKGKRGKKQASMKAAAGIALQKALPNARIVYVSATGATEVSNLAYAERLGLWGRGTAFASQSKFIADVEGGGIAAMELIARDLKQLGLYMARNLSYDGVEYGRVEHTLSPDQRQNYDDLAGAWQVVLKNIEKALEVTGGENDKGAKSAAKSAFWGSHQRFFNQIITSMQMPSVITAVEKDIKEGRQAVLQLTNTNEAAQERAAAKAETAEDIEDLDITPRDMIAQLIEKSFPTQQYEEFVDEDGNLKSRPVFDSEGKPVENKEALAMREKLLDSVSSVKVPQGPLDMILDHFGIDTVAEVTGRGRRFVLKEDETGRKRRVEEARSPSSKIAETDAFQSGKKKILVFSQAGGTGRSYHADNTSASKNARRAHYLVQGGWRADKAVQGFGRTHRTNQASAPIFNLVTTDLQGQKRFISSIARRLGQLGALTKGQRQAGDQGVFSARDNLESTEAKTALTQFFTDLGRGEVPGINIEEFEDQTGLQLREVTAGGGIVGMKQELPEITQFLNRLLSLKIDMQNKVFNAFSDRLDGVIEARRQAGLLDVGLETVRADKIEKIGEQVVHTVEGSGAQTKHVELSVSDKFVPIPIKSISDNTYRPLLFWTISPKGRIYAVQKGTNRTDENGRVIETYRLVNPVGGAQTVDREKVDFSRDWEKRVETGKATKMWQDEIDKAPEYAMKRMHLITGTILPIWDRIKGSSRIVRLQTDDGDRMIGRVIPNNAVADTLKALGAEAKAQTYTPDRIFNALMDGGSATLANGWTLTRRLVAGERRIEVKGVNSFSEGKQIEEDGVFTERIQYDKRYFIPTDREKGTKVIEKITKFRPVTALDEGTTTSEGLATTRPLVTQAKTAEQNLSNALEGVEIGGHPVERMDLVLSKALVDQLPPAAKAAFEAWKKADDKISNRIEAIDEEIRKAGAEPIDLVMRPADLEEQPEHIKKLVEERRGLTASARLRQELGTPGLLSAPQMIKGARDIIKRMVGEHAEVRMASLEELEGVGKRAYGEAYEGAQTVASYGTVVRTYGGQLVRGVIKFAMDSRILGNAHHEGYHAFEDLVSTDQELKLLQSQDLRPVAQKLRGYSAEQTKDLAPFEARAIAYEGYAQRRDEAGGARVPIREPNGSAIHMGVMRVWDKIYRAARALGNYWRKLGFQTYEDVWEKVYEGEMANRPLRATPGLLPEMRAAGVAEEAASIRKRYAALLDPKMVSERAFMAVPWFAKYKAASAQEKDALLKEDERRWQYWNKLPFAAREEFLNRMETSQPQNNALEDAMAADWRTLMDDNWSAESAWGSMAAFVQDYMPHIWERPADWTKFQEARTAQLGPTWFQKKRTYDLIRDGLAAGLKLRFTNPSEIVTHRLMAGVDMRLRMELLYDMKAQGLAWEGRQGGAMLAKRGWQVINAPDRKQWVIHPDIQPIWKNAIVDHGLWGAEGFAGGTFKAWMTLKNVWVPIKLALSLFHPLHVLHINQSNNIARGATEFWHGLKTGSGSEMGEGLRSIVSGVATLPTLGIPDAVRGMRAKQAWEKPIAQQTPQEYQNTVYMTEGGFTPQLSEQQRIKAKHAFAEALWQLRRKEDLTSLKPWVNPIPRTLWHGFRRALEKMQGPIFEKWIPALKAAAYLKEVARVLRKDPTLNTDTDRRVVALQAIARSIDNRYGEMFYGSLFWNRTMKDSAIASFLSLGWNLGFVREFGGGLAETLPRAARKVGLLEASAGKKTEMAATNKLSFVISYVGTAALINALTSSIMGGGAPDDWKDYVFARIGGNNPDGSPRRISNMFYLREVPMLIKHAQDRGGNYITGAWEMLWNKLMFEPVMELWKNRDYWGNNIYDENAPAYKQVWQAMRHTVGEQTSPISISGASRAADLSGKPLPTWAEMANDPSRIGEFATTKGVPLAIMGFGPAPAYVEKSAIQNRIGYLYQLHVAPSSKPYEEDEGHSTMAKFRARTAILVAKNSGDSEEISKAIAMGRAAGFSNKYLNEIGKTPTDIYLFGRLPKNDQKYILESATTEERQRYIGHAQRELRNPQLYTQQ